MDCPVSDMEAPLADVDIEDRRVRRTKAALLAAFVGVVLDKRYDQITVSNIAERAGVGRSTFYEHYRNKDELLKEGLATHFDVLADMVAGVGDLAAVQATVEHFWENRRVANVLFAGHTRQILTRALADALERRLSAAESPRALKSGLPVGLASACLAAAQIGLLSEWLSGRIPCQPAVVAAALRQMAAN